MKSENIDRDKKLREKLEGFSVQPPPMVWDNIKGQLAAQRKKRRIAYVSWISAAAVVLLAFMAGWYFNNESKNSSVVEAQQIVNQNETEQKSVEPQPEKTIITEKQTTENTETKYQQEIELEKRQETEKPLVASIHENNKREKLATAVTTIERIKMEFLLKVEASLEIPNEEVTLAEYKVQVEEFVLSESDRFLVEANTESVNTKKDANKGWKMGMHISPGYSSNVTSHADEYSRNMTYSDESGNGNVGGGFSVQYKTNKRLRVESGIYYAQNGQKSTNSPGFLAFNNKDMYNLAASEKSYFSNSVNVSNGNMSMNSNAGVIELSDIPQGAEIGRDMGYGGANDIISNPDDIPINAAPEADYLNTLQTDGEFSQVFDFIEIPLYLRYSIIDSKFGVEVMGGVNAGVVVGNNAYIDNRYGLQNVGKTQDISSVNLSGTIGLGVNYALGRRISVALEPRFNYYLNSINNNPDVDFRPYRIGIYTGLYYEF